MSRDISHVGFNLRSNCDFMIESSQVFPRFLDSCVSASETAINAINALEIDGMKQLMTCKTDGL